MHSVHLHAEARPAQCPTFSTPGPTYCPRARSSTRGSRAALWRHGKEGTEKVDVPRSCLHPEAATSRFRNSHFTCHTPLQARNLGYRSKQLTYPSIRYGLKSLHNAIHHPARRHNRKPRTVIVPVVASHIFYTSYQVDPRTNHGDHHRRRTTSQVDAGPSSAPEAFRYVSSCRLRRQRPTRASTIGYFRQPSYTLRLFHRGGCATGGTKLQPELFEVAGTSPKRLLAEGQATNV